MAKRKTPAPLLVEQEPRESGGGTRAVATAAGREVVQRLAAEGCPRALAAKVLGVGRQTLDDMIKRDPALADAWAQGLGEEERELVSVLRTQAREGYAPAAMFLLKTRHGYRETGPVDGGSDNRVLINIALPEPKSREDYMRAISGGVADGV